MAQSLDSLENLLKSTNDTKKKVGFLKQIAEALQKKRDKKAISYFAELIKIAHKTKDNHLLVYAYNNTGISWYQQNDYNQSSAYYFKALEATQETPDFYEIKAKLLNNLGWNYSKLSEFQRALDYYKKAESYARLIENISILGMILNNKGVAQKALSLYDNALKTFKESLEINKKASNERQVLFNLNNIGVVLLSQQKYPEALTYLEKALLLNISYKDTLEITNNLINLGTVYIHLNKFEEAHDTLERAVELSVKANFADQKRRALNELVSLSLAVKNYKDAYYYKEAYQEITDSIFRQEQYIGVHEMDARYNILLKDRDLQKVRKDLSDQRFYSTLIISLLLITFVIIFFLWSMIKIKKQNEKRLIKLNQEIETQSEELKQVNEEVRVVNENLERLVNERTKTIQNQKERLLEFTLMNSHKIRGPLATILGLLNLLNDNHTSEKDKQNYLNQINITANKMDGIIHDVNRQLDEEEPF